jgi:glycosyltransferase involved in cell wall biosynthesis
MSAHQHADRQGGVVLLVRSLEYGGADRQVILLAHALRAIGQRVKVLTFYEDGAWHGQLEYKDIPSASVGKWGRWDIAGFIVRLVRLLRNERPSVIYSFLTMPNVCAALLKPWLPDSPMIAWGVRASHMDLSPYGWLARLSSHLEGVLSSRADLIISNSIAGRNHAVSRGFPERRTIVIPNGIDTSEFYPDPQGRATVRKEWGVTEQEVLVGLVARFDPMKDHRTFLRAALRVSEKVPNTRFACVGEWQTPLGREMRGLALELGLDAQVIWAGVRPDIRPVNSALDIACSCSGYGEGFSNAVAEAMACGRACVVTDVGDSAALVGESGIFVPPGDPVRFADALLQLIAEGREKRAARGSLARNRILTEFSVENLVRRTMDALGKQTVTS